MKPFRTIQHSSQSGFTREQNIIVNVPSSGTLGDYLLLKETYKKLDKERNWRYKVSFNIWFLRRQKTNDGLTCAYCGKTHLIIDTPTMKIPKDKMATVDHFIPISKDGDEYNYDNMVVCCNSCNKKKADNFWNINTLKFISEEKLKKLKKYLEDTKIFLTFVSSNI